MPNIIDKLQINGVDVIGTDGSLYVKGTLLSKTGAEINRGALKKATGALAAVDTAGGVFAWVNPDAGYSLIRHVVLNVTTKATSACTVNVGTTASSATTSCDNLIDGVDVATAAGVFTNDESAGTNGKSVRRLQAAKWVTGSVASGASAGIIGTYEVYYEVL